jgi:nucleotidyltransferase substrate binding protein (TIGR01987 family)
MENDIRWKQRFQNFEKTYNFLKRANEKEELSELEEAGLIQGFEFTFELAWKTLKDYLEYKNVDVKFPRDVIKESFKYELISDGEVWLDMLDKRNLMTHTYDEEKSSLAIALIKEKYLRAINQVFTILKKEIK